MQRANKNSSPNGHLRVNPATLRMFCIKGQEPTRNEVANAQRYGAMSSSGNIGSVRRTAHYFIYRKLISRAENIHFMKHTVTCQHQRLILETIRLSHSPQNNVSKCVVGPWAA